MGEKSISLINVDGDISKPADTLINKISAAIGGIFLPHQTIRVAKADTEAAIIRAEGEIKITELQRRAFHRFVEEEAKKQANIESITALTLPQLEKTSSPDQIEDDWITNFFDKCRIVSDKEMQIIWSKILAGESNSPGSFSKRTVNFLSKLEKYEALLFQKLCCYCWKINSVIDILIYDTRSDIYNKNNLNYDSLSHLCSIGLVQYESLGYRLEQLPKKLSAAYNNQLIELELPEESNNFIDVGNFLLTKMGRELFSICESKPVDGFFEYIIDILKSKNYLKKEDTEQPQ